MSRSVSLVREVGTDSSSLKSGVAGASNLSELIDLVPAQFTAQAHILINDVYNAAKKSNHARSYLATLQKHKVDKTFPPEIGGRVHTPTLQISKEYRGSATWKAQEAELTTATQAFKESLLDRAIAIKTAEVADLQARFAVATYEGKIRTILKEVGAHLCSDAGVELLSDGAVPESKLPDWAKQDYVLFKAHGVLFCGRAVALAHAANSKEMSKKFKSLSLKQQTDKDRDGDVGMGGTGDDKPAASSNDTVRAIVQRELAKALQANKSQNPGKGNAKKPKNSPKKKNTPSGGVPVSPQGVRKRGNSNGSSRGRRSNRSSSK